MTMSDRFSEIFSVGREDAISVHSTSDPAYIEDNLTDAMAAHREARDTFRYKAASYLAGYVVGLRKVKTGERTGSIRLRARHTHE